MVLDRKTSLFIVLFCLPLLFLPKINLIKFGGETAGIRIDDLILLCFSLILFWGHFGLEKPLRRIEWWLTGIIAASFFSYFLNRIFVSLDWLQVDAKIFYCVRLFEYFLFFYIGIMASQFLKNQHYCQDIFCLEPGHHDVSKGRFNGHVVCRRLSSRCDLSNSWNCIVSFRDGGLLNLIFCFLIYDRTNQPKIMAMFPSIVRNLWT